MSRDKMARPGAYPTAPADPLAECPLHATFAAVGGKWKLTIVYWLARETHHFSALLRRLAPVAHKVLVEQLRELEADGLVQRTRMGPVPAPVRYQLTDYGRSVLPLVEEARIWGLAQLQRRREMPSVASCNALRCSDPLPITMVAGQRDAGGG
jgi:DNA-binding HxlR family transcriptional regulator